MGQKAAEILAKISDEELIKFTTELNEIIVNTKVPEDETTMILGQFLFLHLEVEKLLTELLVSLEPNIHEFLYSGNQYNFKTRLDLLRAFVGKTDELHIYSCLAELNSIRNSIAHRGVSPKNVDCKKLGSCMKSALDGLNETIDEIQAQNVPELKKVVIMSNILRRVLIGLIRIEREGKRLDASSKLGNDLRNKMDGTMKSRVGKLFLSVQTGKKASELK